MRRGGVFASAVASSAWSSTPGEHSALRGTLVCGLGDAVFLDTNDLQDQSEVSADICIVGGGAAGIAMALQFVDSPLQVLVLESGSLKIEKETQALYQGTVADEKLHTLPIHYRERRFGGTTTNWGGRCMPLDPIDFEVRDYVPHSGWPITRETLDPFYPKANALMEAGEFDYSAASSFKKALRPVIRDFKSDDFNLDGLERFSCPTNLGTRYGDVLRNAPNIRVLFHANLTAIDLGEDGRRVEALTVRSLAGRTLTIKARRVVLATGGLEVTRIMLANAGRRSGGPGIGNRYDLVGRHYMCHLAGTIGALKVKDPHKNVFHGYDVSHEGVYCRRRIVLNADAQRRLRVGNFIGRIHHPRITDPAHKTPVLSALQLGKMLIPYEYSKRLHDTGNAGFSFYAKHAMNVAAGPHQVIGFVWHMFRDRFMAARKFPSIIVEARGGEYSLDFHAEQEPNPISRVTLGEERDAFGIPRINVDWRYTQGDITTVARSLEAFKVAVSKSGVGTFDYVPEEVELEVTRYGAYGGHHIGTTRMGTDPAASVVDQDCRVHDVDNLYIASASVFPTSSQANPTLTVVALALRLAQTLSKNTAPGGRD
jgi:choline dehydrogenase-like flavoprotein